MYLFFGSKASFGTTLWQWNCYFLVSTRRENTTISLQQGSVCLAGKREGVHFVPNPFDWGQKWDLWSDLQWIPHWTHLFGAFGRLWMRGQSCRELKISKWQSPFSDKFMFLLDWMFFRMKVVTICLTKCCFKEKASKVVKYVCVYNCLHCTQRN